MLSKNSNAINVVALTKFNPVLINENFIAAPVLSDQTVQIEQQRRTEECVSHVHKPICVHLLVLLHTFVYWNR